MQETIAKVDIPCGLYISNSDAVLNNAMDQMYHNAAGLKCLLCTKMKNIKWN
jgi:hypothetical protein